jgi:hypothetical protein
MNSRQIGFFLVAFAALIGRGTQTQAFISGINTPGTSNVSITFDDTTSLNSSSTAGTTNTTVGTSPWNGALTILPLTTDSVTGDFAKGVISANYTPLTDFYSVNFPLVRLNQTSTGTGFATLTYRFNIEYQLDAFGTAPQPTIFPLFTVNGTVQPASGSFASVTGKIDYFGTYQNSSGLVTGLVDTVNYTNSANVWTTAGPFSGTASGVPVNGSTPALIPFTTLTLDGVITFTVDPASINVGFIETPEPSTLILGGLGLLGLIGIARRRK